MNILIDHREPPHILKLGTVTQLPAGDVWLQCEDSALVIIERKTASDFLESIKDGRLFNQVSEMLKISQWSYVAIENEYVLDKSGTVYVDSKPRGWTISAIEGAKLSIQELGCGVIHYVDFADCINQLASRSRNSVKIPPRRDSYVFSEAESVLMALPGIGSKKAIDILHAFGGHLGMALEWLSKPGEFEPRIDGIGVKTKEKINELFHGSLELKL